MKTKITKKSYGGVFRKIKGSDLKSNVQLYNQALLSDADVVGDIYFLVYEDDNGLQADKEYLIYGVGYKNHYWCLHGVAQ